MERSLPIDPVARPVLRDAGHRFQAPSLSWAKGDEEGTIDAQTEGNFGGGGCNMFGPAGCVPTF